MKARQIVEALAALEWLTTTSPPVVARAGTAPPLAAPMPTLTNWAALDGAGRYLDDPNYKNLGSDALEPIMLDQIGLLRIESAPRLVSAGDFVLLFQGCLHRQFIDLARPTKKQLDEFLSSTEPYIGIVNNAAFERVATNGELQQQLLRSLVESLGEPDQRGT